MCQGSSPVFYVAYVGTSTLIQKMTFQDESDISLAVRNWKTSSRPGCMAVLPMNTPRVPPKTRPSSLENTTVGSCWTWRELFRIATKLSTHTSSLTTASTISSWVLPPLAASCSDDCGDFCSVRNSTVAVELVS